MRPNESAGDRQIRAAPRDPDLIRQDIARTREELGETVEALTARMDVKARVADRVEQAKSQATRPVGIAVLALGVVVLLVVAYRRWAR